MTPRAGRFAALLFCAICAPAAAAANADMRPHRALYDLSLGAAREGSELAALSGRMALEWADACDGWTVSQTIRMAIVDRDGSAFRNDIAFTSFEAKDGGELRFAMRWEGAGGPEREYVGRAEAGPAGGRVAFSVPDGESLDLPPGTLFPTAHLFLVAGAAGRGERALSRTVFGGTGPDSLNEVTAFIGAEVPPDGGEGEGEGAAFPDLAGVRSWPVSMAYFPLRSPEPEPDFEVAYRLFANGVATDLFLDYGGFAMRAALSELEFPPPPAC